MRPRTVVLKLSQFDFSTVEYDKDEVVVFKPLMSLPGSEVEEMREILGSGDSGFDIDREAKVARWCLRHQIIRWTLKDEDGKILPLPSEDESVISKLDERTFHLIGFALSRLEAGSESLVYVIGDRRARPWRVRIGSDGIVEVIARPEEVESNPNLEILEDEEIV